MIGDWRVGDVVHEEVPRQLAHRYWRLVVTRVLGRGDGNYFAVVRDLQLFSYINGKGNYFVVIRNLQLFPYINGKGNFFVVIRDLHLFPYINGKGNYFTVIRHKW